jgi:hypothetical protein
MRKYYTKVSRDLLLALDENDCIKSNFLLTLDGVKETIPKNSKVPKEKPFDILHDSTNKYFHVRKLPDNSGYNIVRGLK